MPSKKRKKDRVWGQIINNMLVYNIKAGNHKMLVRIANREYFQKQSDLGLHYSSKQFRQTSSTSVQNFRTSTVISTHTLIST